MKNQLLSIAGAIFVLVVLVALFYITNKDKHLADSAPVGNNQPTNNIEPIYPKTFFDFSYEQDELQQIRDNAIAKLSAKSPIRYCGTYFFDVYDVFEEEDYAAKPGEIFDCKKFGTGDSIIKTTRNDVKERELPDTTPGPGTFHERTDAAYTIGDILITETSVGDNWFENPRSCRISITQKGKMIFEMSSDEYECTPLGSVEHGNDVLLLVQEPIGTGNAYTSVNHFLFVSGGQVYNLGNFVAAAGNNGWTVKDFWVDGASFYFWRGDGRYEYKYGQSHNGSTYAFIPRVFKVTPQLNSLSFAEGTAVSSAVASVYRHQLVAIESSFASTTASGIDAETVEAFVPYWVGMARYVLAGENLMSEMQKIQKEAARLGIVFPDELGTIYADIKSSQRSISSL
ncbi:MAG: hypothetical protein WCW64_11440 [Phycisphaerae bacterium]|jgi:hypothetical protein